VTGGLGPYAKYKDSGVPWLGKVPLGWQVLRAKRLFREEDRRSSSGSERLLSLRMHRGLVPHDEVSSIPIGPANLVGFKHIAPGQFVMNRMRAAIGMFGIATRAGLVSPDYAVLQPIRTMEPSYFLRVCQTPVAGAIFRLESRGLGTGSSGFMRLYWDRFGSISLPSPPLAEQAAIVRYLDYADRRIRRYIKAKTKLIALLNEEKQAIVRRAMTCGVDPTVRFKSSGVAWIGAVPQHWAVQRLKWVTRLQRGYDLPSETRLPGPYPVVSSGGIVGYHVESRARAPGVVIGRYGSTEATFFLQNDFWPHNTALFVTDFQGNCPRWCYYMLRTISRADHAGKSAVPGRDRKDLFDILVATPPVEE
jgi:type I restriction enzyme S subunit